MINVPEKYHKALTRDCQLSEIAFDTGLSIGTIIVYRYYLKKQGIDVPRAKTRSMPTAVHAGYFDSLLTCRACGSQDGFVSVGTARGSKRVRCKACNVSTLLTAIVLDDIANFFGYTDWRELEIDLAHGNAKVSVKKLTPKV